jgi:hypothetical protein
MHSHTASTPPRNFAPVPRYDVTLGWVGETALIVTVPTTQGPEAARRRALFAIAHQHPQRNLEDLVVVSVEPVQ